MICTWESSSNLSRNAPPLFSEPGPTELLSEPGPTELLSEPGPTELLSEPGPLSRFRVKPSRRQRCAIVEKEAGSVCGTERSDWSRDHPPEFTEQFESDTEAGASSGVLNDERENSYALRQNTPQITSCTRSGIQNYRDSLVRRFESVRGGLGGAPPGSPCSLDPCSLDQAYSPLHITVGRSHRAQCQHEVRLLETQLKRNAAGERSIRVHDIFKPLPPDDKASRVVLSVGVAGVGKTFSVHRLTLDWARRVENQDLDVVVPLFFRELNLVKQQISLQQLVHKFYPELKDQSSSEPLAQGHILLILDGLDESRLTLDSTCEPIRDITHKAPVNTLVVNLLRGTLLPSALIWITSRPAAAHRIPPVWVHRVTEVRGFFTDTQKEEYFRRRFTDPDQYKRVLSHIRTSHSLYAMCEIPIFSWITAIVLEHMLETDTGSLPQTLTHMYARFLLFLTHGSRKYDPERRGRDVHLTKADSEALLKLGKLAFEQLQKESLMFYKDDLIQAGLDVTDVSYSGVCTEIFKENVIFDKSVYCFIHLSVQEFLAAVYMHHCFTERNVEVLESFLGDGEEDDEEDDFSEEEENNQDEYLDYFLNRAMCKSFQSETGHLDLFVRFLHGLCLESNRKPLQFCLGHKWVRPETLCRVQNELKSRNIRYVCPNRGILIFQCLMEMNDQSVQQQIQAFLKSGDKSVELSGIECSALAHLLQISEKVLPELDLSEYNASPDARLRLMPAVSNCRKVRISVCLLSKAHYEVISAALGSHRSSLRVLDLSGNWLQDTGLETLCVGLNNTDCKLETLLLANCRLTKDSCEKLAHVLERSTLKELDLSRNSIGDEGVQKLCCSLTLHKLSLSFCELTQDSCCFLASALSSSPLIHLDLSCNPIKDCGLQQLCRGLPQSTVEVLCLSFCELTQDSCCFLASALSSSPLRHLDLNCNPIEDCGLQQLCRGLPQSTVEVLWLRCCLLTAEGVHCLAFLEETRLTELDLSLNKLRDNAVSPLRAALLGPLCLSTLRLKDCGFSRESCSALLSVPQTKTVLDLQLNHI